MQFCITGLPRSRTAWFSAYFTATGNKCLHEGLQDCASFEEADKKLFHYFGNSDSGMLFHPNRPKTVVIERDINEVRKSLKRAYGIEDSVMLDLMQQRIKETDGLHVKYEDINERLKEIHEYCVKTPYDKELAEMFMNYHINLKQVAVSMKTTELMRKIICQCGQ